MVTIRASHRNILLLFRNLQVLSSKQQEQALSTRSIGAGAHDTREDIRCKLCKDGPETISEHNSRA